MIAPQFKKIAGHAVLVALASEISEEVADAIVQLDRAIGDAKIEGVLETTPALVNLLVIFDPLSTDHARVIDQLRSLFPLPAYDGRQAKTHDVDVCYEDDLAPDLSAVVEQTGQSNEAVISAHMAGENGRASGWGRV